MTTEYVDISAAAEVLPGFAIKGRVEPDPEGEFQLILGKHLTPGAPYRFRPEHRLRIKGKRNADAYRVEPGDVLIAARGPSNYAVALLDVPDPTIAPATFYILRPDMDVDPIYLAWVLEQAPVQAQIARARTATATPILRRSNFKDVRIPLPPLNDQRCIADLAALMQRERQLLRQRDDATARYHRAIGSALFAGRLRETPTDLNQ
jgi:restriction endonuclease S subunit